MFEAFKRWKQQAKEKEGEGFNFSESKLRKKVTNTMKEKIFVLVCITIKYQNNKFLIFGWIYSFQSSDDIQFVEFRF